MPGSVTRIGTDKHAHRDPRKLGRQSTSNRPDPQEGVRLIKALLAIDDAEVRRALIEFAEALAPERA